MRGMLDYIFTEMKHQRVINRRLTTLIIATGAYILVSNYRHHEQIEQLNKEIKKLKESNSDL